MELFELKKVNMSSRYIYKLFRGKFVLFLCLPLIGSCIMLGNDKGSHREQLKEISIQEVIDFDFESNRINYKIDAFLDIAEYLQSLSKEQAMGWLNKLGQEKKKKLSLFIICRMLFKAKTASEFREPYLGRAILIGSLDKKECPLSPIVIKEGIPLLITKGYFLAGQAEDPIQYLKYCINSCDWTDFRFKSVKKEEKERIVHTFINSFNRERSLTLKEINFLFNQAGMS